MADDMLAKTSFNKQIVIYSFCMNNITQRPYPTIKYHHPNIDYIMYSDDINMGETCRSGWTLRPIKDFPPEYSVQDRNKDIKWHPFREFGLKYDYSIYIDTKVEFIGDPLYLIDEICDKLKYGFTCHMYDYKPTNYEDNWVDVYSHIDYLVSVHVGIKNNLLLFKQLLEKENYPQKSRLLETAIVITDLTNLFAQEIENKIFDNYINVNTYRDQVVVPYVLWKNDIRIQDCGILGEYCGGSRYFRNNPTTNVNGRDNI